MEETLFDNAVSIGQWEEYAKEHPDGVAVVHTDGISMWPLLSAHNDSVFLTYPNRPLEKGDIILFKRSDGKYVAHRLRWMDETKLETIGDNCDIPDGKFDCEQVFGIVTHVCRKGKIIDVQTGFWKFYGKFMIASNPVRMFIRNKIFRPGRRLAIRIIKGK